MSFKDASNKDPIAMIKPKVRCPFSMPFFSEILMSIISRESPCQTEIIYEVNGELTVIC